MDCRKRTRGERGVPSSLSGEKSEAARNAPGWLCRSRLRLEFDVAARRQD